MSVTPLFGKEKKQSESPVTPIFGREKKQSDLVESPIFGQREKSIHSLDWAVGTVAESNQKGAVGVVQPDIDEDAGTRAEPYTSTASPRDLDAMEKASDDDSEIKPNKKKEKAPTTSLKELFRYTSKFDVFLIILGSVGALLHGAVMPLMILVFGGIISTFTDDGPDRARCMVNATAMENLSAEEAAAIQAKVDAALQEFINDMNSQILYFILIACAAFILGYLQSVCWNTAAEYQIRRIRNAFFRSLLRQDIGWYDLQQAGAVTAKFNEDIVSIQKGIGEKVGLILQHSGTFIGGMVIGFISGWKLALVILAVSPLLGLASILLVKCVFSQSQGESTAYGQAGAISQEVISSIRTVTAFSGQKSEVKRYGDNLDAARAAGTRKGAITGVMMGFTFFVIFCSYALGFSYGIKLINDEEDGYDIGTVTTTFFAIIMGTFSVGMSITSLQAFASARSVAHSVFEVIDRIPIIDAYSKRGIKRGADNFNGFIELKNVAFKYPTRRDIPILSDTSLTIEPGTTVAFVGPSGCGKSTIIQLIQRFYDPDQGQVIVDGEDLKGYNIFWFRTMIGSVSQEPVLFGTSIYENIQFGNPSATQQDIETAARKANAHDFISSLPNGYETQVGEQGTQLSGGQKQRIAIARALVRNPKILLLDEATSALDTESEAIVQDALDKASEGRTTIAIAHRLSTIMNADKIIVLDRGYVVETGTHQELVALGGLYARLVEAQQSKDTADADMSMDQVLEHRAALAKSNNKETKADDRTQHSEKAEMTQNEKKAAEDTLVKEHFSASRLWKMALPEMPFFIIGALAGAIAGAVWPVFGIIFSKMMSAFTACDADERTEKSLMFSLIFIAIGALLFITLFLMSWFLAIAGEKMVKRFRVMAFEAMLRQEIGWFDKEENSTGALTARLSSQAGAVRDATGASMGQMAQTFSCLITAIIIGFVHEWRITLIMLAFMPVVTIGQLAQAKSVGDVSKQDRFVEMAAKSLVSSTTNIKTVTSLGIYQIFLDMFKKPLVDRHRREILRIQLGGFAFGLSEASILFAYAAAFAAGVDFIKDGWSTFEEVFTALSAIMFSAFSMGQANATAPDQKKAQLAVAEIFKLFDEVPSIQWDTSEGTKPEQFSGTAMLKTAEFSYPARPLAQILKGLSMEIPENKTVALVGPSGGGKSTIIQLLERFYDPSQGKVFLDDNEMQSLHLPWVRNKISLVSQEPTLFDRTIAENIAYGVEGVTLEDCKEAARQSNIHKFIEGLPNGYNTKVGERGGQLSGGQKQRIAIARALIRNPKMLLLDEATSALDSESEKIVQNALDQARQGRTVVVIAHRLSTIEGADIIAVIKNGVVSELGNHSHLIQKKGIYWGLWNAQQLSN